MKQWLRGILIMMDVRERAVYYLNMRPRTGAQVFRYLKDKGYDEKDIREAVNELKEYNYINDVDFSHMYFEYGFEKGRGTDRIKRELREKGVSCEDIEAAYERLEYIPDPLETAMEIGRCVVEGVDTENMDYNEKKKLQAKIVRKLAYRGFSPDTAYKAVNRLVK